MIGTAQFGSGYGVANRSGVPALSEICAMLEESAAAGINCLDTAASYGESEAILGRALAETGLDDFFMIVTKIDSRIPPGLTAAEARSAIEQSVHRSLRRLRTDTVFAVLLHRDESPEYLDALTACREAGIIRQAGVSLHSPTSTARFAAHPDLGAIQIPANVLDRRFTPHAATARQRGALVFARSTYLQGLLLLGNNATPPHLRLIGPDRAFIHGLAAELALPPQALLLRAMLDDYDMDCVVVGMDDRTQLRENLAILHSPSLPTDIMRRLSTFKPSSPSWIIDPFRWASRAASVPKTIA